MPQKFIVDITEFPGIDFTTNQQLIIPKDWKEEKWQHSITLWTSRGELETVSLQRLMNADEVLSSWPLILKAIFIKLFSGRSHRFTSWLESRTVRKVAYFEILNPVDGRWYAFCMHPASKPGNKYTTILKRERMGGGATTSVVSQMPDGRWVHCLLSQERPTQDQGLPVDQIPSSYTVATPGAEDVAQIATIGVTLRLVGKLNTVASQVLSIFSRYNDNNGATVTCRDGIDTQIVILPWTYLIPNTDEKELNTWLLEPSRADKSDPLLRGVLGKVFRILDEDLLLRVHQPPTGTSACAKTAMAVTRAYMYLVLLPKQQEQAIK